MTSMPLSVADSTVDFDSASDGSNPSGVASLLDSLVSLGWLVNNCYQPDAGLWRVSLRKPVEEGDLFTEWAEGPSMESALEECMSKLADAIFEDHPEVAGFIAPAPKSLIETLGIRASMPNVQRRKV